MPTPIQPSGAQACPAQLPGDSSPHQAAPGRTRYPAMPTGAGHPAAHAQKLRPGRQIRPVQHRQPASRYRQPALSRLATSSFALSLPDPSPSVQGRRSVRGARCHGTDDRSVMPVVIGITQDLVDQVAPQIIGNQVRQLPPARPVSTPRQAPRSPPGAPIGCQARSRHTGSTSTPRQSVAHPARKPAGRSVPATGWA